MIDHLSYVRAKVLDKATLYKRAEVWRFKEATIAFTNGCFDLMHAGHIHTLASAANLADKLVVGLNTDDSVSRLKGKNRPYLDLDSRALVLASFQFVHAVIPFNSDTPIEVIKFLLPDVLVKGGDYVVEDIVGAEVVQASGGRVEVVPFIEGQSSSSLADRIRRD